MAMSRVQMRMSILRSTKSVPLQRASDNRYMIISDANVIHVVMEYNECAEVAHTESRTGPRKALTLLREPNPKDYAYFPGLHILSIWYTYHIPIRVETWPPMCGQPPLLYGVH